MEQSRATYRAGCTIGDPPLPGTGDCGFLMDAIVHELVEATHKRPHAPATPPKRPHAPREEHDGSDRRKTDPNHASGGLGLVMSIRRPCSGDFESFRSKVMPGAPRWVGGRAGRAVEPRDA
jgi:hypothetical protein